jgi:hypothetical protein
MKSLRIGMVLSSLLALCWASGGVGCGSEPGTVDPSSLGGQSGYAGQATSGRGGLAGTMAFGGQGGSGTAGQAGAITAGQAGSSEVQPVWEPLGDILECHTQRLSNPTQVPGFTWEACDGVSDCEMAVFSSRFGPTVYLTPNSTVHDTGKEVRLGLHTRRKEKIKPPISKRMGRSLQRSVPNMMHRITACLQPFLLLTIK